MDGIWRKYKNIKLELTTYKHSKKELRVEFIIFIFTIILETIFFVVSKQFCCPSGYGARLKNRTKIRPNANVYNSNILFRIVR